MSLMKAAEDLQKTRGLFTNVSAVNDRLNVVTYFRKKAASWMFERDLK